MGAPTVLDLRQRRTASRSTSGASSPARTSGARCSPSPRTGSRRRRHPEHGRARRRRMGRQRPEGVDDTGARLDLRHAARAYEPRRAEAQGPHVLRARHARAGRRGSPALPDDRRGGVQRGLPHRCRASRRQPARPRGRGLARRDHHAHERACRTLGGSPMPRGGGAIGELVEVWQAATRPPPARYRCGLPRRRRRSLDPRRTPATDQPAGEGHVVRRHARAGRDRSASSRRRS